MLIKDSKLDFLLRIDWKFISNIFKHFLWVIVGYATLDSQLEVSGAVNSVCAVELPVTMT